MRKAFFYRNLSLNRYSCFFFIVAIVISLILFNAFHLHLQWFKTISKKGDGPLTVFIVTQCRSGSSFLGEIFNQRRNVTYFYEPLYPFRKSDYNPPTTALKKDSINATEIIARCEFEKLPQLYQRAFHKTGQADNAGCVHNHLCWVGCGKCGAFLDRDGKGSLIRDGKVIISELNRHCKASEFRAAKINYLQQLSDIEHLMRAEDITVKVIHLIRDPRATAASLFKAIGGKSRSESVFDTIARSICSRLLSNSFHANRFKKIYSDKFLQIRHEDLAMKPLETAEQIYSFIKKPLTEDVKKWIVKSTTDTKKKQSQASTNRNSHTVVSAWREWLQIGEMKTIQAACGEAMNQFGYLQLYNESDLRNKTIKSFV